MKLQDLCSGGHKKLQLILAEIPVVGLTILLLLFSPIVVILSGLVLLYREIISRFAKWVDPSLDRLMEPSSAIHAPKRVYSNPNCVVISVQFLSGHLDESHLIHTLEERIFSKPDLYPELRQRLVTKFGFQFWKSVDSFQVETHVRSYTDQDGNQVQMNIKMLMEFMGALLGAPFPPDRSPWEFILIPNFRDASKPKVGSVLIFRGHHCLVDGIAIHSLLSKLCTVPPVYPKFPQPPQIPLLAKVALLVASIPCFPYELVRMCLFPYQNYWTKKRVLSSQNKYKVGDLEIPSVELMKTIKERYKVSMTSLINALFVSGFVKLAKSKGRMVPSGQLTMPMFLPGHADQLTNHYTACILPLELLSGNVVHLMRNLDSLVSSLKRFPRSIQLRGYPLLERLNGRLPFSLMIQPEHLPTSTFVLSNMQGPEGKVDLCGYPVEEITAAIKPSINMGFSCLAQSYNGSFKYTVYGDESLFEEDGDLEIYLEGIKEAFQQLSSGCD